jgi:hypothetical protein
MSSATSTGFVPFFTVVFTAVAAAPGVVDGGVLGVVVVVGVEVVCGRLFVGGGLVVVDVGAVVVLALLVVFF